jgi:acyl-coenzyme A synthetase/AMP-(fatty) acid ligase
MTDALAFLRERFAAFGEAPFMVWRDRSFSYRWLLAEVRRLDEVLAQSGVQAGASTVLRGDFSPWSVALFLSLVSRGAVVVPISPAVTRFEEQCEVAEAGYLLHIGEEAFGVERTGRTPAHPLLVELARRGHPGLVLFSSGSTGRSKAAVHDLVPLLEKFHERRRGFRSAAFLLFDHIGGVNTMLYSLAAGGALVALAERSPERVCEAIARHGIELLPTSPSFLNLLLVSEAHLRHDLSSLKMVTYGTEPMPVETLRRVAAALPHATFKQTYGLSELGILRTASRANDSLWVRVGGEDYETRVVDGILHIRARCAMLGYLNAPSPFDADGWFDTQDRVEVDGEWLRILGRDSDIINVAGQKVYPAEVESVLLEMEGVLDATAVAVPHPIMGSVVGARVQLGRPETVAEFRSRMRRHCVGRLEPFKVPATVTVIADANVTGRFKKGQR